MASNKDNGFSAEREIEDWEKDLPNDLRVYKLENFGKNELEELDKFLAELESPPIYTELQPLTEQKTEEPAKKEEKQPKEEEEENPDQKYWEEYYQNEHYFLDDLDNEPYNIKFK